MSSSSLNQFNRLFKCNFNIFRRFLGSTIQCVHNQLYFMNGLVKRLVIDTIMSEMVLSLGHLLTKLCHLSPMLFGFVLCYCTDGHHMSQLL